MLRQFHQSALVLIFIVPTDAQGMPTGGGMGLVIGGELLLLALVIAGCMHQMWLRRQVYHATAPAVAPVPEPALAEALQARARRVAARKLIADDPLIARRAADRPPRPTSRVRRRWAGRSQQRPRGIVLSSAT